MSASSSSTVGGARTRRYHALLLAATTPPTGRVVLVNGIEAWVETAAGGRFAWEYLERVHSTIGAGVNEVHRDAVAATLLGRPSR